MKKRKAKSRAAAAAKKEAAGTNVAVVQEPAHTQVSVKKEPADTRVTLKKEPEHTAVTVRTERKSGNAPAGIRVERIIQYGGSEIRESRILEKITELEKKAGRTDVPGEIKLYVKPEDSRVYYVIDGQETGSLAFAEIDS